MDSNSPSLGFPYEKSNYPKELGKPVRDSMVVSVHLVRWSDMNGAGRLFGGTLMQWIDEAAGSVALRHTGMNVTTVSVDNLHFIKGAYPNDIIVIVAKATYVGNTSMEVRVETFVEKRSGERILINVAYLTLVGIDENDKPARIPPLILETDEEREEWKKAEHRRLVTKKQRAEGKPFF